HASSSSQSSSEAFLAGGEHTTRPTEPVLLGVFRAQPLVRLAVVAVAASFRGGGVNEKQWLRSTKARRMLACLQGKASARKLRLFACAACRDIAEGMDPSIRHTLRLVERVAEGEAPLKDLVADYYSGYRVYDASWITDAAGYAQRWAEWAVQNGDGKTEARTQPRLLRCLFGNPFRPLPPR